MRLRTWSALLVLLNACTSAPAPQAMPRPHAFVSTPTSGPRIRLVSAPMEPVPEQSWIGKADLDKARALLSRARKDIEPRQWEELDRKLTEAERAFERFSRAARTSGQAAEVARGAEGLAQAGRASEAPLAPRCKPIPLPRHFGGHDPHNECADKMPNNSFPGGDVYVNGKNFDALQLVTRTLWEVKTDDFDKHSRRSQQFFIEMKLPEIQRERRLAEECGYNFVVGVRSEAHKIALERADRRLDVVVMDWC